MVNGTKLETGWSRKQRKWLLYLWKSLRSQLTWRDAILGFLTAVAVSAILAGFRQQVIPEFGVEQIANQDVWASKDALYVDEEATALKRSEARASVPSIYQLDQDRISERKNTIRKAFRDARIFLEDENATEPGVLSSRIRKKLLDGLKIRVGNSLPEPILGALLDDRFDPTVENRILKILESVLSGGIIGDREQFSREQRSGIVVRDSSFPFEHPLTDASLVRDMDEAREYLKELVVEFPDWSEKDKESLVQYLDEMLVPTLVYNEKETVAERKRAADKVPDVEVQIKRGQTVVRYGERITPKLLGQLNALKNSSKPSSILLRGLGFFIFIVILQYVLWRYLVFFKSRRHKVRNLATLILVIVTSELVIIRLATGLADILGDRFHRFQDPSTLYFAIPFALGPLLATLLVDVNLGFVTTIILATLTGLFYSDVDMAVYLVMGSLAGMYSIRQYKDRAAIIKAGLAIGILNCVCFAGLYILKQSPISFSSAMDLTAVAFISGILAATLASFMLPALEYFFKIVTDIRLLELSNLNDPILRRLSVEAPGTYHHSLMVATLAEDAAEAIGANPLLTRVSAYYHDIGKILKPEYFVENQSMDHNKHEELSPRISSLVLSSHVKDGLQLAKEIGLPQRIREMIPQHHGTRMMTYFFQKAKESADGKKGSITDRDFRYAGPKPQSKEAAIMMMADSVEATSRTLTEPNPSQIRGMIDRLVDGIVSDGQFDECNITLKDVRLVKDSFFKILTGIFHKRIEYPNYDFKRNDSKPNGNSVQNSNTKQTKTV